MDQTTNQSAENLTIPLSLASFSRVARSFGETIEAIGRGCRRWRLDDWHIDQASLRSISDELWDFRKKLGDADPRFADEAVEITVGLQLTGIWVVVTVESDDPELLYISASRHFWEDACRALDTSVTYLVFTEDFENVTGESSDVFERVADYIRSHLAESSQLLDSTPITHWHASRALACTLPGVSSPIVVWLTSGEWFILDSCLRQTIAAVSYQRGKLNIGSDAWPIDERTLELLGSEFLGAYRWLKFDDQLSSWTDVQVIDDSHLVATQFSMAKTSVESVAVTGSGIFWAAMCLVMERAVEVLQLRHDFYISTGTQPETYLAIRNKIREIV